MNRRIFSLFRCFLVLLMASLSLAKDENNIGNASNSRILEKYHKQQESTVTNYDRHYWRDLPAWAKEAAKVLKYSEELWDNNEYSETEDKYWHQLNSEQQEAAGVLGYNEETWNGDDIGVEVTEKQRYELFFSGLAFLLMLAYVTYLRAELAKVAQRVADRLTKPLIAHQSQDEPIDNCVELSARTLELA